MIKAPPIAKLFQIIKRYIEQPALNLEKSFERDQNMSAGGRRSRSESRIIRPGAEARINIIALFVRVRSKKQRYFSNIIITLFNLFEIQMTQVRFE